MYIPQEFVQGAEVAWKDQTNIHPVGMTLIVLLGTALLILPRRFAGLTVLVMACCVPAAQRISIVTLDFNLLRIMVLFGWARLLIRQEYSNLRWQRMDTLIVAWAAVGTTIYVIQQGSTAALVYKSGYCFDAIGLYFLFRCLVRNIDDVVTLAKGIAVISIPVAGALLLEKMTSRNMFSVFGGVPEITGERFGRIRARGPFAHAILAGTFWAALVPMMAALWWRGGSSKLLGTVGVMTTVFIVIACASSTPLAAFGAAIIGAVAWPLRHWMKPVRWGVLCTIVGLHMVMKAPVWHLIGRIDLVGGSTGYQRYRLIDAAVNNFSEWMLFGIRSTEHWGYFLFDVTNQYVLEGVRGGFATLVLFVAQIAIAFASVGHLRKRMQGNRADEVMAWALGVSMFVHVSAFIAVSYFGQIIVIWFMLLAIITSVSSDGARTVVCRSHASEVGVMHGRVRSIQA